MCKRPTNKPKVLKFWGGCSVKFICAICSWLINRHLIVFYPSDKFWTGWIIPFSYIWNMKFFTKSILKKYLTKPFILISTKEVCTFSIEEIFLSWPNLNIFNSDETTWILFNKFVLLE